MNRINEIKWVMTCPAYPEQYDAFYQGKQVGYLRLRHGCFSVEYPNAGGERIYYAENLNADGCFDDDERAHFLNIARQVIAMKLAEKDKSVNLAD